jgi:hypothetical protein
MVVISEKIFSADMANKQHVGEVHQVYGLRPIKGSACFVERYPIRVTIKSNAALENKQMVGVFSLLPIMQTKAIENHSLCPRPKLMLPATGTCCDCGRYVTFTRMTFEQMLNKTESVTGGAPAGSVADHPTDSFEMSPLSRMLKTDDELDALPTRPYFWGGSVVVDEADVMHRE